jgi:cell division septation protein DedD
MRASLGTRAGSDSPWLKNRYFLVVVNTPRDLSESLSPESPCAPKVLRRWISINPRTQSAERREKNTRTSIGPRNRLDLAMAAPHLPVEHLPVRAESTPLKDSPSAEKIQQINDGSFTLEIATFKKRKSANELLIKLKAAGYNGSSQSVEIDNKTFHRVRQGPYKNLEEANRHALKLAKETGRSIKVIRIQ